MGNQNSEYWFYQAQLAAYQLNIENLRRLADWCNDMADSFEREEEEKVVRER